VVDAKAPVRRVTSLGGLAALLEEFVPPPPPPMRCGIYLLVDRKGVVVYIGQSTALEYRAISHRKRGLKMMWFPVPAEDLDRYEATLIWKIAPRGNVRANKKFVDEALAARLGLPECDPKALADFIRRRKKAYAAGSQAAVASRARRSASSNGDPA
jgi:hypothetical protein